MRFNLTVISHYGGKGKSPSPWRQSSSPHHHHHHYCHQNTLIKYHISEFFKEKKCEPRLCSFYYRGRHLSTAERRCWRQKVTGMTITVTRLTDCSASLSVDASHTMTNGASTTPHATKRRVSAWELPFRRLADSWQLMPVFCLPLFACVHRPFLLVATRY